MNTLLSSFFTFEGPEGAGKTTAITRVTEILQSKHLSVFSMKEPGTSEIGQAARKLLFSDFDTLSHTEQFILMWAGRIANIRQHIIPELQKGNIVLCDRFYGSTAAYQVSFERNLESIQESLIQDISCTPTTFFFDIQPETSLLRIQDRENNSSIDAQPLAFHQHIYTALQIESKKRGWIRVDANASPEEIATYIVSEIEKRI